MTVAGSVSLLERAASLWSVARLNYRDAMVQVGRLLTDYLRARLREASGVNEKGRLKAGITREQSVKDAAVRLNTRPARVNELIRVAAAVDLLSEDGNAGRLSYTSLRWFRLAVKRRKVTFPRSYVPAAVIESESWEPKPFSKSTPQAVFRLAVLENWNSSQVEAALRPGRAERLARAANPAADYRHPQPKEQRKGMPDPEQAVARASARDAAEAVVAMIRRTSDPAAVSRIVVEMLSKPQLVY